MTNITCILIYWLIWCGIIEHATCRDIAEEKIESSPRYFLANQQEISPHFGSDQLFWTGVSSWEWGGSLVYFQLLWGHFDPWIGFSETTRKHTKNWRKKYGKKEKISTELQKKMHPSSHKPILMSQMWNHMPPLQFYFFDEKWTNFMTWNVHRIFC